MAELLGELDELPADEKARLLQSWEGLSPEDMAMPSPKELQAHITAYKKKILVIEGIAKGGKGITPAMRKEEASARASLAMLEEVREDMMMEIVLKKLAEAGHPGVPSMGGGAGGGAGGSHMHVPGREAKTPLQLKQRGTQRRRGDDAAGAAAASSIGVAPTKQKKKKKK
jgi:hypothetical protein